MKRTYLISLLLLFFNLFLLFKIQNTKNSFKQKENDFSILFRDTFEVLFFQLKNSPAFYLNDSLTLTNENNEKVLFKDLLDTEKKVLKISSNNCFTCIENEFNTLKKYKGSVSNIIVIGDYSSVKQLKILKEEFNLNFSFYKTDNLYIPNLDKLNVPYYFSVDRSLMLKSYFITDRQFNFLSEKYLNL